MKLLDVEGGLFNVEELQSLLGCMRRLNQPSFDLGTLVGDSGGPKVDVDGLLGFVAGVQHPQIALHWDDKTLAVSHPDGGVMATFELKF